jgi:hypothetical protein
LYYLKARFYDPELARFMQEDTYRGRQSDPLSLNLYTYCHNNPIKYYDPTGHNAVSNAANQAAQQAIRDAQARGVTGPALGEIAGAAADNAATAMWSSIRSAGGNNPNISFVPGVGYFDGNNNQLRSNEFSFAPGDSGSAFAFSGTVGADGALGVKSTALWNAADIMFKMVGGSFQAIATSGYGLHLGGIHGQQLLRAIRTRHRIQMNIPTPFILRVTTITKICLSISELSAKYSYPPDTF